LVIALLVVAVAGSGWAYAVARGNGPRDKSVPSVMLGPAGAAMAPAPGTPGVFAPPGEIDRGFRLPAPSCSVDPDFHLRIPNIDRIDPGFGPVPSPPPALPRCSGTSAQATPVPRP
jgi:hypothetical protein